MLLSKIFGFDNKSKNKHVGIHQIKKLLHSKETINKIKSQHTEWEKIFADYISDKGLILKYIKNSGGTFKIVENT